ncbi:plasmid partition family protein [Borreliella afzelii]
MANVIEEGLVREKDIIENGIQNSFFLQKDKEVLLNEILKEYKKCKKYN